MPASALRILHAVHDFLPDNVAGSELYANDLARTLQNRGHHVTVLCAAFAPERQHGHVHWRLHEGLPVVEIANNWLCQRFTDTYRNPMMNDRIESVLDAVQPQIVHIHSLLNLTFNLPASARARGARNVATLHDYTLVCPSGGQRIHKADNHVCRQIDTDRCARCFGESPFGARAAFSRLAPSGMLAKPLALAGRAVRSVLPRAATHLSAQLPALPVSPADIEARLTNVREIAEYIDLFIAPSPSIAREFTTLGVPEGKLRVSDYGFHPRTAPTRPARESGPLRIGFVGTPVWHKGAHVLLAALNHLPPASFECTVVGDLNIFPDYAATLRALGSGLPVRFLGGLKRSEVANQYAALDVLVVPSIWLENSPLVIHEAMQAGLPIVGSSIGGIPDLVLDGVNGLLFEAGNANALADALMRLVNDRALLRALAPSSTAVKSLDDDATEWERVYETVLATAGAAR